MSQLPAKLIGQLTKVLVTSQARGLLGPGDVHAHLSNARAFAELIPVRSRTLDLGSGGGVPGLPLAVCRPDLQVSLLDSARRRIRFLEEAIGALGEVDSQLETRVDTLWGRAEDLARDPALRESFDVVVSRLFGKPAVVAECARPFVGSGGLLVVSEPPNPSEDRWSGSGLEAMGWGLPQPHRSGTSGFVVLVAEGQCPPGLPRRVGLAERRPRF